MNIYELIKEIEEKNNEIQSLSSMKELKNYNSLNSKKETDIIIQKTYIKVSKPYIWFIDEINSIIKSLENIMNEKRQLLINMKEKENLKIKLVKNLEEIKKNFYRIYLLLLTEESAPPVIVKDKLEKSKILIKDLKENTISKNEENVKQSNNDLMILEKIEKELKRIEKELKELGILS